MKAMHGYYTAVAFLFGAVFLQLAEAQQVTYYINQGGTLRQVKSEGYPASVTEWSAYYFKKGASKNVLSLAWGSDSAHGAGRLMQKVLSSQRFETRYERWCKCEWGEDTYYNEVAPVAEEPGSVSFPLDQIQISGLSKLHDLGDRLQHLARIYNGAEIFGGEAMTSFNLIGTPFFRAMHNALDQYNKLQQEITRYSNAGNRALANNLEAFQSQVEEAENQYRVLMRQAEQNSIKSSGATSQAEGNPSTSPVHIVGSGRYTASSLGSDQCVRELSTIDVSLSGSQLTISYHIVFGTARTPTKVFDGNMTGKITSDSFSQTGVCTSPERCAVHSDLFSANGVNDCYVGALTEHSVSVSCGGNATALGGYR